jgi:hypothetical protein
VGVGRAIHSQTQSQKKEQTALLEYTVLFLMFFVFETESCYVEQARPLNHYVTQVGL